MVDIKKVQEIFPNTKIDTVHKNNVHLTAIRFTDRDISPCFYLEHFNTTEELIEVMEAHKDDKPFDSTEPKFYVNQVVSKANTELIEKYGVGEVADLAIVRRAFITDEASYLVPKNVDLDVPLNKDFKLYNNIMGMSMGDLIVCTLENKIYGAGVLANTDFLNETKEKYGDFYIFPSSIHEVLFLPLSCVGESVQIKEFADMIKEINATQVAPEERLSDNLYIFDGELKIA